MEDSIKKVQHKQLDLTKILLKKQLAKYQDRKERSITETEKELWSVEVEKIIFQIESFKEVQSELLREVKEEILKEAKKQKDKEVPKEKTKEDKAKPFTIIKNGEELEAPRKEENKGEEKK